MKTLHIFILMIFFFSNCLGQIQVENSQSVEFYVKNVLLGQGIEVGKIKHIGMIGGLGQFDADQKILGVKSGIILTTGNVDSVVGPNNSSSYTSWGQLPKSKEAIKELARGDKDLNKLCRGRTTDISVIEFDFVPLKNILEFNYVFASEEYIEYVGSSFNDVFGFFLNGPGIKKKINLAVLPDGKTAVSVNSINNKTNKKYFRSSGEINILKSIFLSKSKLKEMKELRSYLQFDGFTKVLKVRCNVIPYEKYHIKIAIGDVSDKSYDSGIFLEAGSFASVTDTSGKYFEKLELIKNKALPNIDSLLGIEIPIDSIPQTQIDEDFEITDIHFSQGSYELFDSSKVVLDRLAQYLLAKKSFKCVLYGYTDNVGSKKFNKKLSDNRAFTVMNYLTSKGIGQNKLDYIGRSFDNPKAENLTENGRAKNRRVEIFIEE